MIITYLEKPVDDVRDLLFSILVPVYNSEQHLRQCIDSVLKQTESQFELILVDDGSSDSSLAICNHYSAIDARVTVMHKSNQGSLLARRDALRLSKGTHLVFLDSDDALLPTFLAESRKVIELYDPDIVAFDFYSEEDQDARFLSKPKEGLYAGEEYSAIKELTCTGRFHNLWGRVFNRSIIDFDVDYSPYTGMTYTEDWFLVLSFINNAASLFYSQKKLYWYRENDCSTQHAYNPKYLDYLFFTMDKLMLFSEQWGANCRKAAKRTFIIHCAVLLTRIEASCLTRDEILRERAKLAAKLYPRYESLLDPSSFTERYYSFPLRCLKRNRTTFINIWVKVHSSLKRIAGTIAAHAH